MPSATEVSCCIRSLGTNSSILCKTTLSEDISPCPEKSVLTFAPLDMAVDGATIPGDAGEQRTIPSVPNPHQMAENNETDGGLGMPDIAGAADNPSDMPRNPRDMGAGTGEAISGTGHQMPGEVNTKNAHFGGNNSLAKGSTRYDKHQKHKESDLDANAQAGHEAVPAPGEEGESQDSIRDKKGL